MTRRTVNPVWLVLAAICTVQIGAAFAKQLFTETTPIGMAWLRLSAATLILLPTRPSFRGLKREDWVNGLGLAACVVVINWAIYESAARIPLGLAVTIEFLGPLTVALIGCRRLRDVVWVILAGAGVAILSIGPTSHDLLGIALAVIAASGWAGYILLGARLSDRWRGTSVIALSNFVGAILLSWPAIAVSGATLFQGRVIVAAFAIGLLSSVIPYTLELKALQSIQPKVFGILMALEPVAATLAGVLVLREWLSLNELIAIAAVVAAAIGAVRSGRN